MLVGVLRRWKWSLPARRRQRRIMRKVTSRVGARYPRWSTSNRLRYKSHQEERGHQDESAAVAVTEGSNDHVAPKDTGVSTTPTTTMDLRMPMAAVSSGEEDAVEHDCGSGAVNGESYSGADYPANEGSSS